LSQKWNKKSGSLSWTFAGGPAPRPFPIGSQRKRKEKEKGKGFEPKGGGWQYYCVYLRMIRKKHIQEEGLCVRGGGNKSGTFAQRLGSTRVQLDITPPLCIAVTSARKDEGGGFVRGWKHKRALGGDMTMDKPGGMFYQRGVDELRMGGSEKSVLRKL